MDARFIGNISILQYLLLSIEVSTEMLRHPPDTTRGLLIPGSRPQQATFMCVEKISDDDTMHFRRVGLATANACEPWLPNGSDEVIEFFLNM